MHGMVRYDLIGKEGRDYTRFGSFTWSCFDEYINDEESDLVPMCGYWPEFAQKNM